MLSFPILETNRLRLRELTLHDASTILAIHGDAETMKYFGTDPLENIEAACKLIDKFSSWRALPNPGVRWGLEEKQSGSIIGTCGLFAWNREWSKCTVGYELSALARRKGFMKEALSVALSWGFETMKLNRVEAQIHADNLPSLKLAEELGFKCEGNLREVAHWGGEFHDLLQYSLLKAEYSV